MSTIEINAGTEGPKHDPYGWQEITVRRQNGDVVTIHEGLDNWVEKNGARAILLNNWDADLAQHAFEVLTGITPRAAERAHERYRSTCRVCGCTDQRAVDGYPGETFYICVRCEAIVSSDFDLSAVI